MSYVLEVMELIVLGIPIPPQWSSNSFTPNFVCVSGNGQFTRKVGSQSLDFNSEWGTWPLKAGNLHPRIPYIVLAGTSSGVCKNPKARAGVRA